MVVVILLQHGQGADMGSSFGRGAQGSLIGITGSANILSRATSVLALVFFSTALALGVIGKQPATSPLLETLTSPVPEAELGTVESLTSEELEVPVSEVSVVPVDENQ